MFPASSSIVSPSLGTLQSRVGPMQEPTMAIARRTLIPFATLLALALLVQAAPTSDEITYGGGWESGGAPYVLALLGDPPCDGNNFVNSDYFDAAFMRGPMVGIKSIPAVSADVASVEIFSGEVAGLSN